MQMIIKCSNLTMSGDMITLREIDAMEVLEQLINGPSQQEVVKYVQEIVREWEND